MLSEYQHAMIFILTNINNVDQLASPSRDPATQYWQQEQVPEPIPSENVVFFDELTLVFFLLRWTGCVVCVRAKAHGWDSVHGWVISFVLYI